MKMETSFQVFTMNCWGIKYISKDLDKRICALVDKLRVGVYDFVFLQEIWSQDTYETMKEKMCDVYLHSHYFYSGVVGSGMCIFSKSPILETFYHKWALNGYIHKFQHGDWFGGKGVGLCRVYHKGIFVNLIVAHLHAEYDAKHDEYKAHRIIQAFDTAQMIKLVSRISDVTILAGDLNIQPDSLPFKILCEIGNLNDAYATDCPKKCYSTDGGTCETPENSYTPPAALKQNPLGMRIDFILYSNMGKTKVEVCYYETPLETRVPGEDFSYSDHEAIAVNFKFMKSDEIPQQAEKLVNLKTIEDGLEICTEALKNLSRQKVYYVVGCILAIIAILITLPFQHYEFLWLPYVLLLIRVVSTLLFFFCFLMATFWNRIEENGIKSGISGMNWILKNTSSTSGGSFTASPILYPMSMEVKN